MKNGKENNPYDKELDDLLNSYSSSRKDHFNLSISYDEDLDKDGDVYSEPQNKGEIYFSQAKRTSRPAPAPQCGQSGSKTGKKGRLKKFLKKNKITGGILVVLFAVSVILSIISMSCLNDVLAFNKGEDVISITVPSNATTNQLIDLLHKNKLIKNEMFCKFFMKISLGLSDSKPKYLSGVYYLTPKMGIEKMLYEFREIKKAQTVSVNFPEGYNIDQIAEKLAKYNVCTKEEFYKNLQNATFDYSFVKGMKNEDERYHYLEGYLFPDTYEFYVGENPSSVIRKLLNNFDKKWTDKYAARAKELGMTEDEVIVLASIIQKEADDSEQMPVISSIFHNRLNSVNFPSIQSDATNVYLNEYIKPNIEDSLFTAYKETYSTYYCKGLPVGAICSPGIDAIEAALYPSSTNFYYFCHDKYGNIYTASTEAQHNQNVYKALNYKEEDEDDI